VGEPVELALDRAINGIRRDLENLFEGELVAARLVAVKMEGARNQLHLGLAQFGAGNICTGAATISGGRTLMQEANGDMGDVILDGRTALTEEVSVNDPDADLAEVRFHELGLRGGFVGQAYDAYRVVDSTLNRICDFIANETPSGGIIARTDEAGGIIELRDGRHFALVTGAVDLAPVYEGIRILVEGSFFRDATGVAETISVLAREDIPPLAPNALNCMRLQIAPFQPFNPPLPIVAPDYVLHEPHAYEDSGTLQLEAPMRLGVKAGPCPPAPEDTTDKLDSYRYSLKVEFEKDGTNGFSTIASDLTPGDNPVPLPGILPGDPNPLMGTLRTTEQVQSCIGSGLKRRCSVTPTALSSPDTIPVAIYRRGTLATLNYRTTIFSIEDWDTSTFRVGEILSVDLAAFLTDPVLNTQFEAEGYSASGGKTIEQITPGNPFFAIYNDDFLSFDQVHAIATNGTGKRSGLRWPRVVGERNSFPFWYSAEPPSIIRDRVNNCLAAPNAYYRLPWTDGVTLDVGQGNNGAVSHMGSQSFAFDFSHAAGQVIRAARGGVVDWFQQNQTTNCSDDPNEPLSPTTQYCPPGSPLNWGNAVRIGHQDGTFAWYFHIQADGVLVSLNERVQRGQPIAFAGNTGRSLGPHLHYQVQGDAVNWGQSILIRFETGNMGGCYVPQKDDDLVSNNSHPDFPTDPLP
jgi:murein DD-endopeptidase MepM/ murein hydrolase activator NlpD